MPSAELIAARHPELEDGPLRARYALEGKLGRGGMGVIAEASDRRIGRRVAIKRLAGAPTPQMVERFVREARIQGRLDHPAVVPVYDLGIQSDGRPYFAMRKLRGVTIADLLAAEVVDRRRLLEAFVAVCLAIEYAHTRGVVHRDLKPSNVMLGDFGEVYVLDWGVACVIGEDDEIGAQIARGADAGAGTEGYMAPEQRRGDGVDARADVYAHGCILAEVLGPDAAPELAAIAARARAEDPAARWPSARALAEATLRHVDVDRDLAAQAAVAAGHVDRARAALEHDRDDPDARATAMREAASALALDPDNRDAAALVRSLLLEPPATPPPDVAAALAAGDEATGRQHARVTAISYVGMLVLTPVILWQGVAHWLYPALILGLSASLGAVAAAGARGRLARSWVWITFGGNVALLLLLSRFLGPFVVPPAMGVLIAMAVTTNPRAGAWALVAVLASLGALGSWALEEAGVLGRTMHGDGEALRLTSESVGMAPTPMVVGLTLSAVVLLVVAANLARTVADAHHATRRGIARQAAHLAHLVPAARREDA